MIKIPDHITHLSPYKAGKPIDELAREKGLRRIVKLASNENPLGPSPKATEAVKSAISELHRYPDPSAYNLVRALSLKIDKRPGQIITASGSDALLQYAITAFTDDNDELLSSEGTFIGWYVNAHKYGRKSKLSPLKNYTYDLSAIVNNITLDTKIIYLANPNNPTGTMFGRSDFEEFLSRIPASVIVILDEAYTIYARSVPDYPDGFNYEIPNLIVMRTLSKAYGLAGLRIGYAVGPEELIREMYKVKLPFEPGNLAQVASAAALDDDEFIERTVQLNRVSLTMMKTKFDELGIKYLPTSANFYLLLFPDEKFASVFNEECLNYGLILRHVTAFGIPNGIRINSGTIDETNFALNVIEEVYTSLKEKKFSEPDKAIH